MNICVHTSPGRRGETKPRVFFVGGRRLIVAAILDSWIEDPHRYFEVTGDDGRGFLLRYDSARDAWELAGVFAPGGATITTALFQPKRWWSALRGA
jgi:hypothetical protein